MNSLLKRLLLYTSLTAGILTTGVRQSFAQNQQDVSKIVALAKVERIYQDTNQVLKLLADVKLDKSPMAKNVKKFPAAKDVIDWENINGSTAEILSVRELIETAEKDQKKYLLFEMDKQFYTVKIKDLRSLQNDRADLNKDNIYLTPENSMTLEHLQTDSTMISAYSLTLFDQETLNRLRRHEEDHRDTIPLTSEMNLFNLSKNAIQNEYKADKTMFMTVGKDKAIDALLSLAAYLKYRVGTALTPKGHAIYQKEMLFNFSFKEDKTEGRNDHPSIANRILYILALDEYQKNHLDLLTVPLPPAKPATAVKSENKF